MQSAVEMIVVKCAEANILTLVLMTMLVILLTYYIVFEFIPGIYMDLYLSKLPSMKGKLPLIGHAHLLTGPAPWTKMAQWSYQPNKNIDLSTLKQRKSGNCK